ncbi:sin3 complex subunit [Sporothrix schenckii 1099-18]|uniref:STB6-like N-terminal domain-containing protein n=2 Tax=Sporothrix schenckii TaxID=29908 RepID=U7PLV2_SPOS1|nr:sin3 complex subunit [Sporothrix schenckii 1099-18]ERS96633.1 hypothetical protein HMPREF1624_06842 [Sporothrix schenckii ATCC 58251]KJR81319.1 sin3 complex subunit [Sporothrix schenckii 1099-18]
MSFRFGMPMVQPDSRGHREREEEIMAARQRHARPGIVDDTYPYSSNSNFDQHNLTSLSAIMPTRVETTGMASSAPAPNRRHVVTPDPVSFRYLEQDPCISVVDRRASLVGYELYLVEQWVCSRQSPTIVIATYTGDPNHAVVVGVLSIPANENEWSARLKMYFKTMQQYHARPKDSPFGEIMATNLSSFPSALTVIAVRDGDIRRHRQDFIVNEDLKRLGCSGRSGLTLSEPTRATQEKFQSLYKTSEKIPFSESVVELIKQCQTALFIFGMLESQYIDGLLCDVTETAVGDWWTEVGAEYYNAEPTDGILGPTTVAALLGMLMGARSRLAWYGASVSKDVFDVDNMKKGIGSFQKDLKLERTRRLDHQTLRRLHSVTTKAAAGEGGWGVQKAIKSTVEGFGGKRGELVFGMVGGKDKGNIGDIETLDIDKFISHIYGERPKWLWFGKPRRSQTSTLPLGGLADHFQDRAQGTATATPASAAPASELNREEPATPAAIGSSRRAQSVPLDSEEPPIGEALTTSATTGATTEPADVALLKKDTKTPVYSAVPPGSAVSVYDSPNDRDREKYRDGDRDPRKRTVFKSVAGRVNDARSGLGRIRDAVGGGLRGHASRPSRDDGGVLGSGGGVLSPDPSSAALSSAGSSMAPGSAMAYPGISGLAQASLNSPAMVGRAFTWKNKPEEYLRNIQREREMGEKLFRNAGMPGTIHSTQGPNPDADAIAAAATAAFETQLAARLPGYSTQANGRASHLRKDMAISTANTSVAGSVAGGSDLEGPILEAERDVGPGVVGLLRRHSIAGGECSRDMLQQPLQREEQQQQLPQKLPFEVVWPRRLSFSAAEEAVLGWDEIVDFPEVGDEDDGDGEDSKDGQDDKNSEEGGLGSVAGESHDQAILLAASSRFVTAQTLERGLYQDVLALKDVVGPVVVDRVLALESLDAVYETQIEEVQSVFFQLSGAYEHVQANSQDLLGIERAQTTEAVREVEMLMAKVEYEIGSLASKVQDVEEGVRQFTQQVEHVERRAEELKRHLETESWLHWAVRSLTGIGTGPNIVEAGPRRQ